MEKALMEKLARQFGTPLYVYDAETIKENYEKIRDSIPYSPLSLHYAVMANNRPEILELIRDLGGSVQVNSLYELDLVTKLGFPAEKISFTSIGLDRKSLEEIVSRGVQINLDSVEEVEKYCSINPGGRFGIRVKMKEDIPLPEGHTNSPRDSDVGISPAYFERVAEIADRHDCTIEGIHGYLASNIMDAEPFLAASRYLSECAGSFPRIRYVNFGSGFGVPSERNKSFDMSSIGAHYTLLMEELSDFFGRELEMKIEPGRTITATAGTLLASVTNVKDLADRGKKQVSVDAGFGEFARPRIYGAKHPVYVVSGSSTRPEGKELYDIRANTVLQVDFLARDVELPRLEEGDIIAMGNAGAYGSVMASGFPGKPYPREVIVYGDGSVKELSNPFL